MQRMIEENAPHSAPKFYHLLNIVHLTDELSLQ